MKASLRVLHCPENMGGNAYGLASAERKVGLQSVAIVFEQNQYGYQADEFLYGVSTNVIVRELRRWRLLWRALRQFDIIHFNFGRTIMPINAPALNAGPVAKRKGVPGFARVLYSRLFWMRDLSWLKRAGKGIVITYQGDDARQGDYCRTHFPISPALEVEEGYYSSTSDAHKRRLISLTARYADRMYALNPDLLHLLPPEARFLPYTSVDLAEWKPAVIQRSRQEPPLLIHAPSHRGVKGTRFVLEAVNRLQKEGVRFKFVLVENLSREEARRIYEQSDILVDQLLCGWYGGVAIECMALGIPVIAYIRQEDLRVIPIEMRAELPIIQATPQTIYNVLKDCLTKNRDLLLETGRRGRAYVEKWHDPVKIAEGLKREYETIVASSR